MVPRQQIERRLEAFRQMCRSRGLRVTPQRVEIFRALAASEEHPDAEGVLRRVRRRLPNVSLDTVYRVLYRLEQEGLIWRAPVASARLRFDGNREPHHHFVCSRCGLIRDFQSEAAERIAVPEEVSSWGSIRRRHLQILGVCRRCLSRGREREEP